MAKLYFVNKETQTEKNYFLIIDNGELRFSYKIFEEDLDLDFDEDDVTEEIAKEFLNSFNDYFYDDNEKYFQTTRKNVKALINDGKIMAEREDSEVMKPLDIKDGDLMYSGVSGMIQQYLVFDGVDKDGEYVFNCYEDNVEWEEGEDVIVDHHCEEVIFSRSEVKGLIQKGEIIDGEKFTEETLADLREMREEYEEDEEE